ncbi:hypothetical protein Taro_052342, partial [Colocasia esculenta]|nr:hypothetical protein [Colocasia esculenta]
PSCVSLPWTWLVWPRGPCLVVSALRVLSGCLVQTPDCCFGNPFLGVVRGGIVASFPTGSECELQESVVVVAGCACCEREPVEGVLALLAVPLLL